MKTRAFLPLFVFGLASATASRVATAEALYELAREQRDAGNASGADVLRAPVSLSKDPQRLLEPCCQQQALLAPARAPKLRGARCMQPGRKVQEP